MLRTDLEVFLLGTAMALSQKTKNKNEGAAQSFGNRALGRSLYGKRDKKQEVNANRLYKMAKV
jgi:hypothetical protein